MKILGAVKLVKFVGFYAFKVRYRKKTQNTRRNCLPRLRKMQCVLDLTQYDSNIMLNDVLWPNNH